MELKLSEVLKDNDSKRIDSEYFKKHYLQFISLLKSKNHLILNDDSNIKGGKRLPLGDEFSENGTPYIRAEDNKKGFVDFDTSPKITDETYQKIKAYQTNFNDVLITNVGNSIGDVGIVKFSLDKCNLTENCIKIINLKENNPNYIFSFLNSKYGNLQILRETVGTAQPKLAIERVRNFKIPILSNYFQLKIETLVNKSHQTLEQSKTLYKQSEEILLKELDLLDFEPSKEKVAIKSFSDSFGSSGRLDSEYYLPMYDEVIGRIKKVKYDTLLNIVDINKSIETGSEAYQDEGIEYIRVANLYKMGLTPSKIFLDNDFFDTETVEKLQPKKDTILLSKDGTVGIAYAIKNERNIITSGAILHLSIRDKECVLPEYLTLVLNSLVVQMQSKRDAGGSIIKHWKPSEIGEVLIPIIDINIQTQIEEKIKESFKLKEESKRLLEVAKRAVEMAIEEGEDMGMGFIKDEVDL